MLIPESWLREWCNPSWDSKALSDRLTMSGFEVEGRTPAAPEFFGVVVGRILECKRHPKADKLQVCTVTSDGSDRLQIVCGASNARAGLVTALAKVGARLPNDLIIKQAKLREVESNGMLCSARELGLGEDSEGILELPDDTEIGRDLRQLIGLDDSILEINVTPNRGDCQSVQGLSREVAAIAGIASTGPRIDRIEPAIQDKFPVTLSVPAGCPKFTGRVIRGVNAKAKSPLWIRERLRRSGLRSINPIVDITNYVMLELGTPMHAYDLAKLSKGIEVRNAREGETLKLLDGKDIKLDPSVLVIADGKGPVGLAGVMGGDSTAVSEDTVDVFLEMAYFSPTTVSVCSRKYGLITDAAQRFERGVDPRAQERGQERAAYLLLQIAGGKPGPLVTTQVEAALPQAKPIRLRRKQVSRIIGMAVTDDQVHKTLTSLQMQVKNTEEGWQVTPPSHRFDLAIEEDLIEEVARIIGFDNVPEIDATIHQVYAPHAEARVPESRASLALADRGYQEAITYSFVDQKLQAEMFPGVEQLPLSNPIADNMGAMRVSLWPGLLLAARDNLRRQQPRVRLFEAGRKFVVGQDKPGAEQGKLALGQVKQVGAQGSAGAGAGNEQHNLREISTISGVAIGTALPEQWGEKKRAIDFYDVKADVEALLELTGAAEEFEFRPGALACMHPGRSAEILRKGEHVGWLGELHPVQVRALDLTYAPIVFELETETALRAKIPVFEAISRFPAIRLDMAVIVDESVPLSVLKDHVSVSANKLLRDLVVFDVYRGPGVDSGRKSVALGLILQEQTRTLTDQDADGIRAAVKDRLRRELNASIRDQ